MVLECLEQNFAVCKINDIKNIDFTDKFCFVGKTDEEISLVCSEEYVPDGTIEYDKGWRALRICGTLDFSLIGILSKLSAILAENEIGIFAVSTYNTDYILTKKDNFETAVKVLKENGYTVK